MCWMEKTEYQTGFYFPELEDFLLKVMSFSALASERSDIVPENTRLCCLAHREGTSTCPGELHPS